VAFSSLSSYSSLLSSLLSQRSLPPRGFSPLQIQHLLSELTLLDTNNCPSNLGVGEREGRVFSSLLSQRFAAHGIGRSGDLLEPQPKAAGTSIMIQITYLCLQSLLRKEAGLDFIKSAKNVIVLPVCTGKSMEHALLWLTREKLKRERAAQVPPDSSSGVVLWCRIDQKSCLKSTMSACLDVVVVETRTSGDLVATDLGLLKQSLSDYGSRVVAIVSCTSCFAPPSFDAVDEIAKLAAEAGVAHVVNNAYGLYVRAKRARRSARLSNRAKAVAEAGVASEAGGASEASA